MHAQATILLVDDEELFLRTATDYFAASSPQLKVLTAKNGKVALELLGRHAVDLVVTDLKMPILDGFELLTHMTRVFPHIPAIVMTAFGTPEIEARARAQGVTCFLDKPFDFLKLQKAIEEALSAMASGHLTGISLATFLQMIQMERKSCVVSVQDGIEQGLLHFREGRLTRAQYGSKTEREAALALLSWEDPVIEIIKGRTPSPDLEELDLTGLLMEAYRLKDEIKRVQVGEPSSEAPSHPTTPRVGEQALRASAHHPPAPAKEDSMASINEKLKDLTQLDGFVGCGVFTPTGEPLAVIASDGINLKDIGVLANNVLMNAQKASIEMGTGRGQQVHVETEKSHILARCLNEGTDPLKSQPGKAHIHLVLIVKSDATIGMAKMRLNTAITGLAEDFRS